MSSTSTSPAHAASVTPTHSPQEADASLSRDPAPPPDKSTPPITVLIAEDDPDLRDIFTIAFRYKQFEVRTVRNGEEAINTLKAELPQVLVLDISMPKVSGIDVLRHIREQGWHSNMHCIVVTANPGYKYDPEIEGVSLFLVKPVSVDHLTRFAERLATHS